MALRLSILATPSNTSPKLANGLAILFITASIPIDNPDDSNSDQDILLKASDILLINPDITPSISDSAFENKFGHGVLLTVSYINSIKPDNISPIVLSSKDSPF